MAESSPSRKGGLEPSLPSTQSGDISGSSDGMRSASGFGFHLSMPDPVPTSLRDVRVGNAHSSFKPIGVSTAPDGTQSIYITSVAYPDNDAYQSLIAKLEENHLRPQQVSKKPSGSFVPISSGGRVSSNASTFVGHDSLFSAGNNSEQATDFNRLQRELENTKKELARKEDELNQTRIAKFTLERGLGPAEIADPDIDVNDHTIANLQSAFNASMRMYGRVESEVPNNSSNGGYSSGSFGAGQNIWGAPSVNPRSSYINNTSSLYEQKNHSAIAAAGTAGSSVSTGGYNWNSSRPSSNGGPTDVTNGNTQPVPPFSSHNAISRANMQALQVYTDAGLARRYNPAALTALGRSKLGQGFGFGLPFHGSGQQFRGPSPPETPVTPIGYPVGTHLTLPARNNQSRLSPTAAEFNYAAPANSGPSHTTANHAVSSYNTQAYTAQATPVPTPWNVPHGQGQAGVGAGGLGSMNGERENWKLLVEKIVHGADQQSSIHMQQRIKVIETPEKHRMCEAILGHCYTLMINRFGNFLVQRVLEWGTPAQILAVANAIRGHVVSLSMDPFGCHVVQKAFDTVPEPNKAAMVHELLRSIPDTVIHRYACHVWQKLFELRWSDEPPQIMVYVNEALRGMWHEVALGETGSLVVQNIFENCLEEDKRPCVSEVLANIDTISHGQYGNWCIQHICENGDPVDRNRAIEHILNNAGDYSMDQYASKVVEKCLKVDADDFVSRYLQRVTQPRADRPRLPLIDIAGDQYGNYLVQWILAHGEPHHHDIVVANVRKHMVSLRGSKFGSRVAMACTHHATHTRPGPPAGLPNPARFGHFANQHSNRGAGGHNNFR